ncbi:NUDIX hydrolase [Meiothermus granaticius]|uniref:CTP pyrophosphohydrolase n=1 Tax=Meiothermus granaticius NBRC 107808 TaxID=1227551 RepID=A0A399FAV0_9DEIN|nr:NUDIX domain-containing protein [Meiothermus granaticius]RIH93243.1 CTP pyrophosphohydrolase [Meiothermus granaticius NBRC 107808]GEM86438.1 NUDIX hydrolase [Meiothermus granaticius NBRC 107808]
MIEFDQNGTRFYYRVAGVAIKEGQVLLCRHPSGSYWVLPGGRVIPREDSKTALRREIREELCLEATIGPLLWVVENFFELNHRIYHELGLYYRMEVPLELSSETFVVLSASIGLEFGWFRLDQLPNLNLQPPFLRQALRNPPTSVEHVVQGEFARKPGSRLV